VLDSSAFVPSIKVIHSSNVKCGGLSHRSDSLVPRVDGVVGRRDGTSDLTRLRVWGDDGEIVGQDRIKACIPYLLPMIDGDHFGRYIYLNFPVLKAIDDVTIAPLANIVHSVPFLSLILFLILSLGTRSSDMARGVKFNAQQAVLIDVALIFPELIGGAFEGQRMPTLLMASASNFVWYFYITCILYSVVSNLRGKKPDQIPWISNAAEMSVGPY